MILEISLPALSRAPELRRRSEVEGLLNRSKIRIHIDVENDTGHMSLTK